MLTDTRTGGERGKPRVIPEGGFHKSGTIVEAGDTTEFLVASYVRLNVDVTILQHHLSLEVDRQRDLPFVTDAVPGPAGPGDDRLGQGTDATTTSPSAEAGSRAGGTELSSHLGPLVSSEHITGDGRIRKSRYGCFELSLFGSDRVHGSVAISLRRGETTRGVVFGYPGVDDIDLKMEEGFCIEITLGAEAFDDLHRWIQANPSALVQVQANLSGIPGFYAAWSPTIDEGRAVKFLADRRDLENPEDLPAHMRIEEGHAVPFRISVTTGLAGLSLWSETAVVDNEQSIDEEGPFGQETDPVRTQPPFLQVVGIAELARAVRWAGL